MGSDVPRVPQAHGGSLGGMDGAWDVWGLCMYTLVGTRHVEGGLGHVGEVWVCGWARTCASWARCASSWGIIVVVGDGACHHCYACDVSLPVPRVKGGSDGMQWGSWGDLSGLWAGDKRDMPSAVARPINASLSLSQSSLRGWT